MLSSFLGGYFSILLLKEEKIGNWTNIHLVSSSSRSRPQGEMNGHRGLVPSNFLEEVPDDVEVYLTDTPSHYPQEEPANRPPANSAAAVPEGKRVHHHRRSQR